MDDFESSYTTETLENAQYLVQEYFNFIYFFRNRISHIHQKINLSQRKYAPF